MKRWTLQLLEAIGWSKRQWILVLIVTSLFLVTIIIAFAARKTPTLNDWLVLLTGVVVLIYTVETQALRVEVVRQNDISVQLLVIIGIHFKKWENRIFLQKRWARNSLVCENRRRSIGSSGR
jgi:hypothetical protein